MEHSRIIAQGATELAAASRARPVRVLFLVPQGLEAKGGIGRMALYLSREFAAAPGEVTVRIVSTRWTALPVLKHLTTLPALLLFAGYCAIGRGDLVHINVAPRGSTWRKFLFWRVARLFGAKTVLHLHGSGYDGFFERQGRVAKGVIGRFFRGADHVVVLGRHWRNFVVDHLGVPPRRVSIVANGAPHVEPSRERRGGTPLIVSMGLVGERKGTDMLIAALAALPPELDWHAVIGGDGEVERYRAVADAAGLGERISFLGWVGEEEVGRWLDRASVFVLPSRAENQPVAILEAMAQGLPVVASAVGAIPEQVAEGETGLLVPPGEAEPLAAALRRLLESPHERAAFGAAGHARYREHFSISRCARELCTLYRTLAG
ncbi:MAG TPA: glycosyltransferase family 4 protein [Allosphingosinicella sp.]